MNGGIILFLIAMPLLVSCQANYIRDVQGGSVSPSASTTISGTSS
ncbi:colicin release lysis protein [Raoultella terrigena]|uniref:Lysis protein for colicin n=1 Tax=Raoultella terrigena TaxID=577 RepID=A0AAQ0BRM8_RAOTE|nr:colicin release lysis protein [Raoultella terrigena]QPF11810.1 colicin release lysis protein [Raoultella terrigena]